MTITNTTLPRTQLQITFLNCLKKLTDSTCSDIKERKTAKFTLKELKRLYFMLFCLKKMINKLR